MNKQKKARISRCGGFSVLAAVCEGQQVKAVKHRCAQQAIKATGLLSNVGENPLQRALLTSLALDRWAAGVYRFMFLNFITPATDAKMKGQQLSQPNEKAPSSIEPWRRFFMDVASFRPGLPALPSGGYS